MRLRVLIARASMTVVASLFAGVVTVAVGAASAGATAQTYYVSPAGSDNNPGTQAAPWHTVAHGLGVLTAGDTLYLRGGTYVENITSTSVHPGTATSRVLVTNFPGERPVVQGLLWLRSPSYWTFDGINVTWNPANPASSHMVKITDGVGWTINNGEIWGAHSYAAMLVAGDVTGQPADWTVSNNCIHDTYASNDTNQDHLIYANTGVSPGNGLITHNLMFNATNGEAVKLGGATQTSGAGANVRVDSNTMYNTAQNVLIGWQSHDNAVTGNLLGLVSGNYGNVRGYQLSGANNTASSNLGFKASKLILNDAGYPGIADSGANQFPVDPQFDDVTGCAGFHPQNAAAAGFGRYAGASAPGPAPTARPTHVTQTPAPVTNSVPTTATRPVAPKTAPSPTTSTPATPSIQPKSPPTATAAGWPCIVRRAAWRCRWSPYRPG